MRQLLVRILGTSLSFYVATLLVQGFQLTATWESYLIAAVIFTLLNWVVLPLIKLLLLPINLLTLGIFRWIAHVIILYIFDVIYDGITISAYTFPGFSSSLISLPPGNVSLFWSLVLSSLVISVTYSIISTLLNPES